MVQTMLENIRSHGHLATNVNPLEENEQNKDVFNPEKYGKRDYNLKATPVELVWE
jgi:2-oxoglutarate dehydrogenase E1 component